MSPTRDVRKTPQAFDDLAGIASTIAAESPDAACRFLDAAERLFELLSVAPDIGEAYPHPRYPGLRLTTLGGRFRNYVVAFEPSEAIVTVVRVWHGARDTSRVLDPVGS